MNNWEKFKKEHGVHDYTEIVACEKSIQEYIRTLLEEERKEIFDECLEINKINVKVTKAQCADGLEEIMKSSEKGGTPFYEKLYNLIKYWRVK